MQRHEIPTHLNIEDRAFAGLTMRQLMVVIIGLGLAYAAVSELPLHVLVRLATGVAILGTTAAVSLWQPGGRSVEDWAFVLLRYIAVPRVAVWRVRSSRADHSTPQPALKSSCQASQTSSWARTDETDRTSWECPGRPAVGRHRGGRSVS